MENNDNLNTNPLVHFKGADWYCSPGDLTTQDPKGQREAKMQDKRKLRLIENRQKMNAAVASQQIGAKVLPCDIVDALVVTGKMETEKGRAYERAQRKSRACRRVRTQKRRRGQEELMLAQSQQYDVISDLLCFSLAPHLFIHPVCALPSDNQCGGLGSVDEWLKEDARQQMAATLQQRLERGWLPGGMEEEAAAEVDEADAVQGIGADEEEWDIDMENAREHAEAEGADQHKAAPVESEERPEPGGNEVERLVATEDEKSKFSKINWVWCTVCEGGSICKAGRRHKGDTGHDIMSLGKREKEQPGFMEQALQEFLRVQRFGKAAKRELVREHQQAGRDQQDGRELVRDRPAASDVYRMTFGRHGNKTIAELLNSEDNAEAQYIPYLYACRNKTGPQDKLVELELALRREGFWDRMVKVAQALAPKIAEMSVMKLEDLQRRVAAGEHVHPDVLREAQLMDQKCREDAAASESVVSGMSASAPPAKADKRRRVHRSQADVENTHCSYCGQLGHRKPGCPRAEQDALDEMLGIVPVTRSAELVGTERQLHQVRAHLKYTWTDQRTETYEGKRPRARQGLSVSGHEICRMSALDMVNLGLAGGILTDLQGNVRWPAMEAFSHIMSCLFWCLVSYTK